MRRWILRLVLLLLAAALLVGLRATVWAPAPLEVDVATVARGTVESTVTNSRAGTVRARRRARLSPEIGGTVVELPFREGRAVPAGAVVLRLEDSLQRARLDVARREVEAAAASRGEPCLAAERARRELERTRGLIDDGIVSTDRLDAITSAADTAAAGCAAAAAAEKRARAQLELAEAELAKTVIRAPFAGVVAELRTEVGEYTTPSPPAVPVPPVIDVLDPTSIYVSAPMDEVDSARVRPGQPVIVTVDSHRGEDFPGRVVRVAPYVLDAEEQNRTVEIEVELDDAGFASTLLPGTSADVEVILERHDGVLRIPAASLLDGRRVLRFEDGRLRTVEVGVGLRNWDYCEVTRGLAEGDRVVSVFDRAEIRDGAEATVRAADGGP